MTSCKHNCSVKGYIVFFQKRNRPLEPPKQPKATPFFLPTLAGLVPEFVTRGDEGDIPDVEAAASKILDLGKLEPLSPFQRTLEDTCVTRDCESKTSRKSSILPFSHCSAVCIAEY